MARHVCITFVVQVVDLLAFIEEPLHVFGDRVVGQGVSPLVLQHIAIAVQVTNLLCDAFRIVVEISAEKEISSRFQMLSQVEEKIAVDQSSAPVAFFGPGIRAVDIDRRETLRLQTFVQKPTGFNAHDTNVLHAGFINLLTGFKTPFIVDINSEEVCLGLFASTFKHEMACAAAYFQCQRMIVAENGRQVQWLVGGSASNKVS